MRLALLLACLVAAGAVPARAGDHQNLDSGRPLRVEDAEPIAFREMEFKTGLGASFRRGRAARFDLEAGFNYGFALDTHLTIDAHPSFGGQAPGQRFFDFEDVTVGVLHNFNREYDGVPALSLRADVALPTGRGSRGLGYRLRGIASRTVHGLNRLHLNVDLEYHPSAGSGERQFRPGLVLGYSTPLGYPTRFDRTALAELALITPEGRGQGPVLATGIGLRQQVRPWAVWDFGVRADLVTSGGAPRERLRLVTGYSTAF